MRLIKLTDAQGQTFGGMQWGEGVSHTATGTGLAFCSSDLIHVYTDPYLAMLFNPVHGRFDSCLMWAAAGEIVANEHGVKYGVKTLTTIRQIVAPSVAVKQYIRFGIYCALSVYKAAHFRVWASQWLDGTNQQRAAAQRAASAADATRRTANAVYKNAVGLASDRSAARAACAVDSADAAQRAADAAARAACAVDSADAAQRAADAAERAAFAADIVGVALDFSAILPQVFQNEYVKYLAYRG